MIRIVQVALLLAIMIPFGIAVRWGVNGLGQRGLDFGSGIIVGIAVSMLLDAWDRRRKARGL